MLRDCLQTLSPPSSGPFRDLSLVASSPTDPKNIVFGDPQWQDLKRGPQRFHLWGKSASANSSASETSSKMAAESSELMVCRQPLKVLIATGGTGGHLFPARQLAEMLPDCEVFFAGHKLRDTPFFDRKIPYLEIASAPSKRKWPLLLKGLWQSLKLIFRFHPDVVVGFGSFHSFPVLLAASLLQRKIILFEPNCSLGKVNRFFTPFAKKLAFQFPLKHPKAAYVPLLPWIQRASSGKKYPRDPSRRTILVFGGSQGAVFINKTFCAAAALLRFPFQLIHLTGKEDPEIKYAVPAVVKPFEEDMAAAYEAADFAVCRAGANTVAELIRFQKPAVLIPYPYAYDHQRKNGEFLQQGVRILLQRDATPERLAEEIEKLQKNLEMHRNALRQIERPQTIDFGTLVRTIGEEQ